MDSPNNTNFPFKYIPKPVSGASLDSGLGPSINSRDFNSSHGRPYDPYEIPAPTQRYSNDPSGTYSSYGRPPNQNIDSTLFARLPSQSYRYAPDSLYSTSYDFQNHSIAQKADWETYHSSGLQFSNRVAPSDSTSVLPDGSLCHVCKAEDGTYTEVSSYKGHLRDKHGVQAWEYRCLEPDCTVTTIRRGEMREHMWNVHEQSSSLDRIAEHRSALPCPTFCEICLQSTTTWMDFYEHAEKHCFPHFIRQSPLDDDKGGYTTGPGEQLGQQRKGGDEYKHTLGADLPIPRMCTRCSHDLAKCRTCKYLPESVRGCHMCYYSSPAHRMRRLVAAILSAYSDAESMCTAIRDNYFDHQSLRKLQRSLAYDYTEIRSLFNKHHQKLGEEYEEGDSSALEQIGDIATTLEMGLLEYLRRAQKNWSTTALSDLEVETQRCRARTLVILEDLYQRLSESPVSLVVSNSHNSEQSFSEMGRGNAIFSNIDTELDQPIFPDNIQPDDPTVHRPRRLAASQSSASSAALSIATNITSPECEQDSLDADIPETKPMDHILDAAHYFNELDQLEVQTAQILGMENGPYTKLESLDDCIECLLNCQAALDLLQSQGFCGTTMSILIEDQERDGIASASHITSSQIGDLLHDILDTFEEGPLKKLITNRIQTLFNVETRATSNVDSVELLRFLCKILSVGIISFSGSHVCRFDVNLWHREVKDIPIGFDGYIFKPRKLACLDDFIGGPAWILCKTPASSKGLKISFTVQDLQELWGPVSLVGGTADEAPLIQTERGFITPLRLEKQSYLSTSSLGDEIECHWLADIPEYLTDGSSDTTVLIRNTSRILIGTTAGVKAGLVVNEKCKSSISLIGQQIACRLQYPGTSKSRYVSDGYDVQLGGGQFVTAGLMKKYKRIPKRTLKAMLVADCKRPDTRLAPLLNIRVGLEVSACTGNAQRVTLWDALRFSQTSTQPTDHSIDCAHKVGDMKCISSCWTRWQSMDDIDSLGHMPGQNKLLSVIEARRVIINSIIALEHSGVDSEGNLQVSWPFSDSPANCLVLPSTPRGSHNWFRVIKDTRDTSCFAVFSQRCLEFPEEGIMRSCSAPCKEGHSRSLQTTLSTRILTPAEEGSVSGLLVGVKFQVGEAHLTVTKAVQDQLAMIAAVSMNPLSPLRYRLREILPDARAFDYKEHIWSDITTGLSVPVFVH